MLVRHVVLDLKPDRLEEAVAIFEHQALPLLRAQEGFAGASLLSNGTGCIVILTCWERAADFHRIEAAGFFQQQVAKFLDVIRRAPTATLFESRVCTFRDLAPR